MVLAPFLYGALYPQPYLGQTFGTSRSPSSTSTAPSSAAG